MRKRLWYLLAILVVELVWLISVWPREGLLAPPVSSTSATSVWRGRILAGNDSHPLIVFNQADYETALAANRPVFLFFYADWSPLCREEAERAFYPAFNDLINDNGAGLIGFRVRYADRTATIGDRQLASSWRVANVCTKIWLDADGIEIGRTFETWDKERYVTELSQLASDSRRK